MANHFIATLLTDFGCSDPYVASMKGVILSMCPRVQLVDICHDVPPHDVMAAAFILAQTAPNYPPQTLHIIVVDPGVGNERRIIVGQFGGQLFMFPDNGVITLVAEAMPLEALVTVRNTRYIPMASPSMTFHGRDIVAPVAGHILNGLDIRRLGSQPEKYKLLELPVITDEGGALIGQVIYVDRFGNLISNISETMVRERFKEADRVHVVCAGKDMGQFQGAYGLVDSGLPLALFNSMGLVEVAVNRGRACDVVEAGVGAEVRVLER